jgi:hypothetical protein
MKINQVVVMYLNDDQVSRLTRSTSYCFSMRHDARRSYSCWCKACSRVRGRGFGCNSYGANLVMPGCPRTKLTFWTEDQFVVTVSPGIRDRETEVAEIVARELQKAKPGEWECVQARESWSTKEETHMRPGHHWILKFGNVAGSMSCVEKKFKLAPRKYEEYKDLRFRDGDCGLVVDVWLHRVDEDASGLTFYAHHG